MYRTTTDLINRVAALVDEHAAFFSAVREWYSDAALATQAARLLLARSSSGARVAVAVNGLQLAGDAAAVAARAHALRWTLPAPPVAAGENEITVSTDPRGSRLYLRAAAAAQEGGFPEQTLDLTRRRPDGTPNFVLADSQGARFDGDVWVVQPGGWLGLRVRSAVAGPASLVLGLVNESVSAADVIELLQKVAEEVQKVRERLEADRRAARGDPARANRLAGDVADLDAYLHLHRVQVEPAFRAADGTLRDVIARTGDPDRLTGAAETDEPAPRRPGRTQATPVAPARQSPPRDPPRRDPPSRPRPSRPPEPRPARSGSTAVSCLAVLAGGVLVVAGLGYAGWSMLRPVPAPAGGGAGNAGDEITARVRAAGGNQTGPLTVSLVWYDKNDLDLSVVCPGGDTVWYDRLKAGGGTLDVDRNDNPFELTDAPVENAAWSAAPPPGRYRVHVNFFTHNEAAGAPAASRFVVRVVANGRTQLYPGSVTRDQKGNPAGGGVLVAEFDIPGN